MRLNTDQTRRTLVHGALLPWVASPAAGVQRRMLYRDGEEKARATSLVRYAAGSTFRPHSHPGGEEFLVLEGIFQDERGDYPAGTYVRNPPGSSHAPASTSGCVIFVRLQQFDKDDVRECFVYPDQHQTHSDTRTLFSGHDEHVTLHDCPAGTRLELSNEAGLELLILSGSAVENGDLLQPISWLRLPAGIALRARIGNAGARIWIKRRRATDSVAELS